MNSEHDPASDTYTQLTTAEMAQLQNDPASLRLLLAQRLLHNYAKRWAILRYVGLAFLALGAPVAAYIWPATAVVVGAVSALWIFLARTVFKQRQLYWSHKAASVQEMFDHRVFGISSSVRRTAAPTPEEMARVTGDSTQVLRRAQKERLTSWYPFITRVGGISNVAIAQRANSIYSEALLRRNARIWLGIVLGWSTLVVIIGTSAGLSLSQFVLGIALPLLPALLDAFEERQLADRAAVERRQLDDTIEVQLLAGIPTPNTSIPVWQNQVYGLRCSTPQVPNVVYKTARDKYERAMNLAADQLAQQLIDSGRNQGRQ